ncbi:MAG: Hsp20/alpha crystallin family protein [Ktedonobacteraceae bacterium]|nr:Hsp20/alpha crystallin family protein [Ktedonobacteraceae bacterium]
MLSRLDPWREALSLRRAMDQLFEQSFISPRWTREEQAITAPMDVCETDQGYEVRVFLAGMRPEDINLTVTQNTLTIQGEYRGSRGETPEAAQQPQRNWLLREIRTGSFQRSVTFERPIDVDHVQTSYEHGELTITLPVIEASRPRRIAIAGPQHQPHQITVEAGQSQG